MEGLDLSIAFAVTAGLVHAFIATVFLRFRRTQPQWGLGWLAGAFVLAAVLNLGAVVFDHVGGQVSSFVGLMRLILGVSTVCALVVGVRCYTGASPVRAGLTILLLWAIYLSTVLARLVLPVDAGLVGNGATALVFSYLCWRFLVAHRAEPDAGHGIAAAMVGLYPPLVLAGWWWGLDQYQLRHWSAVPFSLAGLGVMSATMGRLRADVLRLNATLEERVTQRTQALQDMLSSLESFSSMVSHDVKGTLGGISGLSRVAIDALQQGDTAKAKRLFESIGRESDNMVEVVSDLLMLARASQSDIQKKPISLAEVVHEARQALSLQYGEAMCQCIHMGDLPTVAADPGLLRQVLVNLLSNALKFSRDAQHPVIEVSSQPLASGHVITVQDNGAGFDPEKAKALFQPFQRLDASGRFEGSGVGLTIVRRIVERHGGRVWAEGRVGQGASFHVWLPTA